MERIQKLFSYTQGKNIWRIILTDLDQIVIEERDIQKKEVFYSCIDRLTGKFYWKNKTFLNEKFWIGIEGTRSKYLILHQFEKPDMPNHKKIINVDLLSGEVSWVNDELTFFDMDNEFIYAFNTNFGEQEFFQLRIEDGTIRKNLGNIEQSKSILDSICEKDYSRYSFPKFLTENSSHSLIRNKILKIISENPYSNFYEFIEKENYLIFNYYDKVVQQSLINRLIVYDKKEDIPILVETLNTSTPAPIPDSFFMYDDDLYYIKNKVELVAYRLNL